MSTILVPFLFCCNVFIACCVQAYSVVSAIRTCRTYVPSVTASSLTTTSTSPRRSEWTLLKILVSAQHYSHTIIGVRVFLCTSVIFVNPLMGNCNTTSNNIKLVHWSLMDGLLHLVQQRGDWAGLQPSQAPHRCTKCNSPSINGQCTNAV